MPCRHADLFTSPMLRLCTLLQCVSMRTCCRKETAHDCTSMPKTTVAWANCKPFFWPGTPSTKKTTKEKLPKSKKWNDSIRPDKTIDLRKSLSLSGFWRRVDQYISVLKSSLARLTSPGGTWGTLWHIEAETLGGAPVFWGVTRSSWNKEFKFKADELPLFPTKKSYGFGWIYLPLNKVTTPESWHFFVSGESQPKPSKKMVTVGWEADPPSHENIH